MFAAGAPAGFSMTPQPADLLRKPARHPTLERSASSGEGEIDWPRGESDLLARRVRRPRCKVAPEVPRPHSHSEAKPRKARPTRRSSAERERWLARSKAVKRPRCRWEQPHRDSIGRTSRRCPPARHRLESEEPDGSTSLYAAGRAGPAGDAPGCCRAGTVHRRFTRALAFSAEARASRSFPFAIVYLETRLSMWLRSRVRVPGRVRAGRLRGRSPCAR